MYHITKCVWALHNAEGHRRQKRRYSSVGGPDNFGIPKLTVVDGSLVRTGTLSADLLRFAFTRSLRGKSLREIWRTAGIDLFLLIIGGPLCGLVLLIVEIDMFSIEENWSSALAVLLLLAEGVVLPMLIIYLVRLLVLVACQETLRRFGSVVAGVGYWINGPDCAMLLRTMETDHKKRVKMLTQSGRVWKARREHYEHVFDCVTELIAQLLWKCRDRWSN